MNKQEALDKIKELENYINDLDKKKLEWSTWSIIRITHDNAMKIKFHDGWRLPTITELSDEWNSGVFDLCVTTYWSSSTGSRFPTSAWVASFKEGLVTMMLKNELFSVRCVREVKS